MKKVLLPTDFSDNAWNAVFTAVKLYAEVECRFYLLHAYEPNALNMVGRKGQQRLGIIYESLSEYAKQELDKSMVYLKKNHSNPRHRFEVIAKSDTLGEAVEKVMAKKDIALVCMGTKGATGAKGIFIGSNTVKVLKKIRHCPILAVPADYDFKKLRSLAFPTDFSRIFQKHQLLPITELASLWNATVEIIHVAVEFGLNDQQRINQKWLKEHFDNVDLTFYNIDFEANVAHTLENFISNTDVDLMALIKYHHSFWEKLIGEPVVRKLAFHTKVPLLILPE